MLVDMAVSAGAVYRQYQRMNGVPAENPVQAFFDQTYPDDRLAIIYPHMQFVGRGVQRDAGPNSRGALARQC